MYTLFIQDALLVKANDQSTSTTIGWSTMLIFAGVLALMFLHFLNRRKLRYQLINNSLMKANPPALATEDLGISSNGQGSYADEVFQTFHIDELQIEVVTDEDLENLFRFKTSFPHRFNESAKKDLMTAVPLIAEVKITNDNELLIEKFNNTSPDKLRYKVRNFLFDYIERVYKIPEFNN